MAKMVFVMVFVILLVVANIGALLFLVGDGARLMLVAVFAGCGSAIIGGLYASPRQNSKCDERK